MVGVFDSGIGGLTVVREIKKKLPNLRVCYFGDTARVPWGGKSQKTIQKYSEEICDFLILKGAKKIVIACNTASALAGKNLREKYPQIEFFDVIDPVIDRIKREKIERVGVIGTKGTIGSGIYEKMVKNIDRKNVVFSKACPLLVPLAEEGWVENEIAKDVCEEYLKEFRSKNIEALILGCTHYPLLKKSISETVGKKVRIISSAEEVVNKLFSLNFSNVKKTDSFYFSDWTADYQKLSQRILGCKIKANIRKL